MICQEKTHPRRTTARYKVAQRNAVSAATATAGKSTETSVPLPEEMQEPWQPNPFSVRIDVVVAPTDLHHRLRRERIQHPLRRVGPGKERPTTRFRTQSVHSQSKRYRDASSLSRFTPLTLIDKQPRIGHGVAFVEAPPLPRCSYPSPHVLDIETVLQTQ
jgi:hypothetical protein